MLSYDPLAKIVPALLKATEVTFCLCPYKIAISVCVSIFHSFIVLSADPLARIVSVLLKQTDMTPLLCPYKIAIFVFVSMFQSFIV